jgi:hypothetical protein
MPPLVAATIQFAPESDEVKSANSVSATSLVPSAEEATLDQFVAGALVAPQLAPEFVEV